MEIFRALGALLEPPSSDMLPLAALLELPAVGDRSDHTDLFALQLHPYASVYLGREGMIGGDARDRIAGFWRTLGDSPADDVDYLPVMLASYAALAEQAESELDPKRRHAMNRARSVFLWDHLLSWLPVFVCKVKSAGSPFYTAWGALLQESLFDEARRVGPLVAFPSHFSDLGSVVDPRTEGNDEFFQWLLSPARSGLILLRSDLVRLGRVLGTGVRLTTRRAMLEALLAAEPSGTLRALSEEAGQWKGRHLEHADVLAEVSRYWADRAEAAESLLSDLGAAVEAAQTHS